MHLLDTPLNDQISEKPSLNEPSERGPGVPNLAKVQPDRSRAKWPDPLALRQEMLLDPGLNKGTAFTGEERDALGLRGLLPPRVISMDRQVSRVMQNLEEKSSDLDKYIYLNSLRDRNETLFYRVLIDHLFELMPIVYTPTIGLACQEYGSLFGRSRGMYISDEDRGKIREILNNWPIDDVRAMVVTDGERILGLGDLGAHGMGIPVGKLALYTACAGLKPSQCLPVTLDVGTNNETLLEDPLYIGLPHKRIRGKAYDDLLDEFMAAVHDRFPNILIQFEDFGNSNAFRLLEKYRDRYCVFNDDIQGTAAVTLAGIFSALRVTGGKLADQRVVLYGAGEAATGISDLISRAMASEGMSIEEARCHCWLIDSKGLVVASRGDLVSHKKAYAHDHPPLQDLSEIIDAIKPTILIGASGQTGSFTKDAISTMMKHCDRPIIFALSNPTSQSECTAEEAYRYTDGHAIFASGSPFPDVVHGRRAISPGQANNAYIFPGVGLGVIASRATRVTEEMFFVAAKTLAAQVTEWDLKVGRVYPSLERIREVSARIAEAVARVAFARGLTTIEEPADLGATIANQMYQPEYKQYA